MAEMEPSGKRRAGLENLGKGLLCTPTSCLQASPPQPSSACFRYICQWTLMLMAAALGGPTAMISFPSLSGGEREGILVKTFF